MQNRDKAQSRDSCTPVIAFAKTKDIIQPNANSWMWEADFGQNPHTPMNE